MPIRGQELPMKFGKYELLARIGEGGMAEVYRARQPGAAGFEKTVVIKRMLPHLLRNTTAVQMFVAEAKLAAAVQHKNIVQVFELEQHESGELFIVMEYVQGVDLRELLRIAATKSLRLPIWFSVHVMCELLEALAYAHDLEDEDGKPRHVVHRDVSPSNIFLSSRGEVKLGDFGVARDDARASFTRTGQIKGKVAYMPPEQLYGKKLDRRADLFGAGVVLWECLTQRRLFGGRPEIKTMNLICKGARQPPSELDPSIPPALDAITLAALEPDPEQRVESAHEFLNALVDVRDVLFPKLKQADVKQALDMLTGKKPPDVTLADRRVAPAKAGTQEFESTPSEPEADDGPVESVSFEDADDLLGEEETFREKPVQPDPGLARFLAQDLSVFATSGAGTGSDKRIMPDLELMFAREQKPVVPVADLEIEALVHDAVKSVEPELRSHAEELPPDSILAGIEIHKHANKLAEMAAQSWASQGIIGDAYKGEFPFWGRDTENNVIGPCSYKQIIYLMKGEARFGRHIAVSIDKKSWLDLPKFAELTGQELLLEADEYQPPKRGHLSGKIQTKSLTAILGTIAKESLTGRLIIVDEGSGKLARRELHVVQGKPTWAYANTESLQLPNLMIEKHALTEELLPETVHKVVKSGQPLDRVLSERTGLDTTHHHPIFMKERLAEMFGWVSGRYVFDTTQPITHTTPFAKSVLQVLPEMVHRSMTAEKLKAALLKDLDAKLEVSERYGASIRLMNLNPQQLEAADHMAKSKRIGSWLKVYPEHEKLYLTMGYVLLEIDLLLRPVAR